MIKKFIKILLVSAAIFMIATGFTSKKELVAESKVTLK